MGDKVNAQLRSSKGSTVRTVSSILRREGIEVCRETVRRVLKKDLKKQSFRTVRGQMLNPRKNAARAIACQEWKEMMQSGALGHRSIVSTDEKLFRIGKDSGASGQNRRV